ncbi:MarR family winged helix-turn-helix transcriptional regulator [Chondromyces crocatus]|uniref:MarR family transcriptional regulator n=1 Tax=Chondromyces crocatus TaxID=52 RepID=A0A0K1EIU4_CHOCO|nr:MarR family transcriptional regulator [Chondromyces crocatus]AKT40784.1 MarR family transcriptional regulator [Chondromyces crocatus]
MQEDGAPHDWEPESTVSFWINVASRALLRQQEGLLRPLGFGMSQMPVLHALGDGGSMSQKDLARWARVEQPTMAEMLGRMERDGVVQRVLNPEDRRGSLVSLTRKARARLPKARAALIALEQELTEGFSEEEKALLSTLLQRVAGKLAAEPLGVPPPSAG